MTQATENTKEESKKATKRTGRYFYGLGRRKSAIAQVRLYEKGKGEIMVNNREFKEYFPLSALQTAIEAPLAETNMTGKFDVVAKVIGGGIKGQAESIQLGIARALIKYNEALRKPVKAKGYLSRDSRIKERKKPGLKRARRAPQWSKR